MLKDRLNASEPKGLERAYCDICDGTFTVARGQCTGCIRREENRKQGVIYVLCGVPLGLFGVLGVLMFGLGILGIASLVVVISGLVLTTRGLKAMVFGRSAE